MTCFICEDEKFVINKIQYKDIDQLYALLYDKDVWKVDVNHKTKKILINRKCIVCQGDKE